MLTAMSVAWFQKERSPNPAAVGVLCASIGNLIGGDAAYITGPLNGMPALAPVSGERHSEMGYLSDVDPKDPLAYTINSPTLVAKFPSTLLVTSTRAMELSAAINSHNVLVRNGLESGLHVWDGLPHAFWYNSELPGSREVYGVIAKFFDYHLRR